MRLPLHSPTVVSKLVGEAINEWRRIISKDKHTLDDLRGYVEIYQVS
jgi:hypothetical protein